MAATTEPATGIRQLSCQVNGESIQLDLPDEDGLTLLDVLRDFLGITSPKNGCQPQAQCGCCTVLMDGKPVLSCALSPVEGRGQIDHHARRTRRGAPAADFRIVRPLRRRAVRLLHSRHGDAGRRAVRQECRRRPARKSPRRSSRICAAARATRRSSTASSSTPSCAAANRCPSRRRRTQCSGRVGTDLPRYTGHDAVLGDRKFIDDMTVPEHAVRRGAAHRSSAGQGALDRRQPGAGARWRASRCHGGGRAGRPLRRTHRKRLAGVRGHRRRDTLHAATSSPASSPIRSDWPARRPS